MNSIQSFFLLCSGVDPLLIKRTPTEVNKFVGIGATVFFTGLLAFVSGGFAIYTIFGSYLAALFFGLLWGLMIFNLDRYIVSSMKNNGNWFKNFLQASPRIILAVIIAVVISKPLELKIFDSEIRAELVSMQQEKYKEQEDKLKARYDADIEQVKQDIQNEEAKVKEAEAYKNTLLAAAMAEADGTGGSQIRNMGPIYKAKKAEADKAALAFQEQVARSQPLLEKTQTQLEALEQQRADDLLALEKVTLDGFAAQMDALGRLSQRSSTILWASIFISLLFIAIETAPVMVKLMSSRSPYDYVLNKTEHQFAMNHKAITERLSLETKSELDYLNKTKAFQIAQLVEAENDLFAHAVKKRVNDLKEKDLSWKNIIKGQNITFEK
jgi:hypothetical protein